MLTDESFSRLTLRDYFAACALQGMISNPHTTQALSVHGSPELEKKMAKAVYVMADAMLKARNV